MEMFGNGITEFSLHRYHYGMEILATKKDVLKITEICQEMDCSQNLRNERPAGTFVLAMVLEQESPRQD